MNIALNDLHHHAKLTKASTERFLSRTVRYREFDLAMEAISEIHGSTGSKRPRSMLMLGMSGVGKTRIANTYLGLNPAREEDGRDIIPVLYVNLQEMPSSKGIIAAILKSVDPRGASSSHMNEFRLKNRLITILKQYGVEMIIIDEIQHVLPEHNETKRLQHIIDSIKHLIDETKLPFLLIGQKSAERLLEFEIVHTDEENQLRQRFRRTRYINEIPRTSKAWTKVLSAYRDALGVASIDFSEGELSRRFHAAARGRHSGIVNILIGALEACPDGEPLMLEHLVIGYSQQIAAPYSPSCPFTCNPSELSLLEKAVDDEVRAKSSTSQGRKSRKP